MSTSNRTTYPRSLARGRRSAVSTTDNGTTPSLLDNQERETCAVTDGSDDRARLRAVADEVRAAGIPNADKLLRIGASEMAARSLATWRARGSGDLGVLAQMLAQGGPSAADTGYISQRQRVLADMNAWQRGYPDRRAS